MAGQTRRRGPAPAPAANRKVTRRTPCADPPKPQPIRHLLCGRLASRPERFFAFRDQRHNCDATSRRVERRYHRFPAPYRVITSCTALAFPSVKSKNATHLPRGAMQMSGFIGLSLAALLRLMLRNFLILLRLLVMCTEDFGPVVVGILRKRPTTGC